MAHFTTLTAVLVTFNLAFGLTPAHADIANYAFELVSPTARVGAEGIVDMRLIDKRTGAPMPDALIIQTRLDMASDGMASMTSGIASPPSDVPTVYRFQAALTMAGGWPISHSAKAQGEEGTLDDELVLAVTP